MTDKQVLRRIKQAITEIRHSPDLWEGTLIGIEFLIDNRKVIQEHDSIFYRFWKKVSGKR